jgi:hypothetical protein
MAIITAKNKDAAMKSNSSMLGATWSNKLIAALKRRPDYLQ